MTTPFYLDSSAWVKRHQRENGSDWMSRIWSPSARFACASLGLIEVLCTVARRNAANPASPSAVDAIFQDVRADYASFVTVPLDDALLREAETLALRRALRGADCVHLASAVRLRDGLGVPVTLIASDRELLAAAAAEGFATLDPNFDPPIPTP